MIVQGRRISLVWLAQQGGQQTVLDLFETAPDQQVLAATAAGLVVVDGVDADPQSAPAYLADLSDDGRLTPTGTLPTYDDLEISPGGSWLVLSPAGTLGGEVASVATLTAQEVAGGDEVVLEAPARTAFAAGTWAWEDDRTLVAVLLPAPGGPEGTGLARCDVTLGECRALEVPEGATTEAEPDETTSSEAVAVEYSAPAALDDVIDAVVAGERGGLVDRAVIGDDEWDQLVDYAADGGGSGGTCRDNGGGTQDCEIAFDAAPATTYYAILEPAPNDLRLADQLRQHRRRVGLTRSSTRRPTGVVSPTSRSSARRTDFLTGSTKQPRLASGKTDVRHVEPPIVTSTRTEPKPRGGPPRARTSSLRSAGTLAKTHPSGISSGDHSSDSNANSSMGPVCARAPTSARGVVTGTRERPP